MNHAFPTGVKLASVPVTPARATYCRHRKYLEAWVFSFRTKVSGRNRVCVCGCVGECVRARERARVHSDTRVHSSLNRQWGCKLVGRQIPHQGMNRERINVVFRIFFPSSLEVFGFESMLRAFFWPWQFLGHHMWGLSPSCLYKISILLLPAPAWVIG